MEINVNGQTRQVQSRASIAELLSEMNITARHVAVEVNLALVPREQHATHTLSPGDRLEVVTLVGGG